MKCVGNGCNNNVKEGHCELCHLEYQAKQSGYRLEAEIKDDKILGMVFVRNETVQEKAK